MRRSLLSRILAALACCTLLGCVGTDWSENYDPSGQDPFDLLALRELLAARPESFTTLTSRRQLSELDTLQAATYLFVGAYPYYTDTALTRLLDYVERGNEAFLATRELPEDLAWELFDGDCEAVDHYDYAAELFPSVYLDSVRMYRYPRGDSFHLTGFRYWEPAHVALNLIEEDVLCAVDADHQVLGGIDTVGLNFIRVTYGQGAFYVHTNPIFFTNWYLLDSLQYRYAENVLSVIGERPIAWDEGSHRYRRSSSGASATERNYQGGRNLLSGNQTLRYIMEHRALAFAWYTLLAGVLLYVIFRGKRRQRIIPVLPERENSSRRFIDTISRLVRQKGNHAALAQRELAALRFHLNQRLGIRWAEGHPPPPELAERSGLPAEVVGRALTQIRVVEGGRPLEDGDLLRFYRAIEPLYRV